MLIDSLAYVVFVFACTKAMNGLAFKDGGASRLQTWVLTAGCFIGSAAILSVLKVLRLHAVAPGIEVHNPLDVGGAMIATWVFYITLNRERAAASDTTSKAPLNTLKKASRSEVRCSCGTVLPLPIGYSGNVRCHYCNKIHHVNEAP